MTRGSSPTSSAPAAVPELGEWRDFLKQASRLHGPGPVRTARRDSDDAEWQGEHAALPAPADTRDAFAEPYAAPRTETEGRLASLWTELLGIEAGVDDNFFDLGGHSLLATQLMSRIQQSFDVELPLRHLFEFPTVAALAATIDEARRRAMSQS